MRLKQDSSGLGSLVVLPCSSDMASIVVLLPVVLRPSAVWLHCSSEPVVWLSRLLTVWREPHALDASLLLRAWAGEGKQGGLGLAWMWRDLQLRQSSERV